MTMKTVFEKVLALLVVTFIIAFLLGWRGGFKDAAAKCNVGKLFQMHKTVWDWDFTDAEDFSDTGVGCIDDCLAPIEEKPEREENGKV